MLQSSFLLLGSILTGGVIWLWRQQKRLRDIAERRLVELRMSEERLKLAVEGSGVGLFDWDLRTNKVIYSAEWKRQIGCEDHEIGDGFSEWERRIHPDDLERTVGMATSFARDPWPNYEVEFRFRHKDSSYLWILTRAAILRDEAGKPSHMLGCHIDITQLKRIEDELKRGEARYRQLFDANPNPMWVYDLETLRFLDINLAAERTYGYTRDEFLSMTIADIRPAAEVPRLMSNIAHVRDGFEDAGIWIHQRRDGTRLCVEITSHTLEWSGRRAEIVQAHDVTGRVKAQEERRALEARLREAQKMEAMGRLAGGVAHDFNNQLTVILGYCELIQKRLSKGDPAYEHLVEIRRAGENSARLTQQLLAFSRSQVVAPGAVDLNRSIGELERMMQRALGENIRLILHLDPNLRPIMADAGQIQQILMNLAVNARDSMPDGGCVVIETANAVNGVAPGGGETGASSRRAVLLLFSDTGSGFEEEAREHVFEPFFSTQSVAAGTGLGLPTVHAIVQQMGGSITLDSEKGHGTTFKIVFPACEPSGGPAAAMQDAVGSARGAETILIAEDQDEIRNLAAMILRGYGYHVLAAASGAEAIERSESHAGAIDLLLTDVVMPGMTGQDLAKQMLARRPRMKALYMSGYTAGVIGHQGMLEPGMNFLSKPFGPAELALKVRQVLDQAQPSGEHGAPPPVT